MSNIKVKNLAPIYYYIFLSLLGGAISYLVYLQTYTVNPDGMLYLQTANAYLTSGVKAAFATYFWPFYSIAIALFAKTLHIPLEHAVYLLDGFFQVMIPIIFCLVVRELDNRFAILCWAGLLSVSCSIFNDYRGFIIRDFGYWLFFLIGLLGIVRYVKKDTIGNILLYYVGFLVGFLFRVEAFIFLLLPLSFFLFPHYLWRDKFYFCCKIYLPLFLLSLIMLLFVFFHHQMRLLTVGRLPEIHSIFLHGLQKISTVFSYSVDQLREHILSVDARKEAVPLLFFGLIGLWLKYIFWSSGFFYWLLFMYAHRGRFQTETREQNKPIFIVLYMVILLYLVLTLFFIFAKYFLVRRYLLGLTFVLMLWAPLALEDIRAKWQGRQRGFWGRPWVFPALIIIFLLQAMSGIISFGPSNAFIAEGARWLAVNTDADDRICTNNKYILFSVRGVQANFARDFGFTPKALKELQTFDCNYYALELNRHDLEGFYLVKQVMPASPAQVFSNRHGDELFIYHLSSSHKYYAV